MRVPHAWSGTVPRPRIRKDGELNYFIRRLKNKIGTRSVPTGEVELRDSEAYLLGKQEWGIYLIPGVAQPFARGKHYRQRRAGPTRARGRAHFAAGRVAFGKPIIEHPLMRRQFDERCAQLREARALMWEAIHLLDEVWQETPRYSDRYHLFRLIAHLAKYWTAELAVQFAKWNMEVHGGLGVLAEYPAERWLREAMILPIWEGTPHRQMLDGLEVMERKQAHEMCFDISPLMSTKAIYKTSRRGSNSTCNCRRKRRKLESNRLSRPRHVYRPALAGKKR
jgi:alkylation response protein AidB-like acyl-CoA dehydrogenase